MQTDAGAGNTVTTAASPADLFTIGHSTHPAEVFTEMLRSFTISRVVDVRTIPRSRHNPQFDSAVLQATLQAAGIGYTHRPDLGGLRKPVHDSPNGGWHNASFRGFADYMRTEAFKAAIDWLVALAHSERLALMCAEQLPWRCHRSLIADALVIHGLRVCHIMAPEVCRPHRLTAWARVDGSGITYPPQD